MEVKIEFGKLVVVTSAGVEYVVGEHRDDPFCLEVRIKGSTSLAWEEVARIYMPCANQIEIRPTMKDIHDERNT
jgi:hypothetical protein